MCAFKAVAQCCKDPRTKEMYWVMMTLGDDMNYIGHSEFCDVMGKAKGKTLQSLMEVSHALALHSAW